MLKLYICSGNARFKRYLALASGEPGPPAGTQRDLGCFAGAPPDAAFSLPTLYQAAPRSGSSLRKSRAWEAWEQEEEECSGKGC